MCALSAAFPTVSHPTKGQPSGELPCHPTVPTRLGDVVAERRPHHVVDSLGPYPRRRSNPVIPRPTALGQIGILEAPPKPALRSLVELVPETKGGFLNEADITRAGPASRWC